MSVQTTPLTERQLDLITRAHCDAGGLIEPLLTLKGGAKLKMIASLVQRSLIEQRDGQWRITPAAIALVQGERLTEDAPDTLHESVPEAVPEAYPIPTFLKVTATDSAAFELDAETEATVTAAEATWQAEKQVVVQRPLKVGVEGATKRRPDSKQAQVIGMLQRPEGATIAQIGEITGWQSHTTRGFFAGAVKKKLGLTITSHKPPQGERVYRVEAAAA